MDLIIFRPLWALLRLYTVFSRAFTHGPRASYRLTAVYAVCRPEYFLEGVGVPRAAVPHVPFKYCTDGCLPVYTLFSGVLTHQAFAGQVRPARHTVHRALPRAAVHHALVLHQVRPSVCVPLRGVLGVGSMQLNLKPSSNVAGSTCT